MSRSSLPQSPGDDGFTLIELLVTITISIIILLAMFQTADLFTSGSAANSRLTDAEDRARSTVGTFVRSLRDAPPINVAAAPGSVTPIAVARPHDVIFRSTKPNGWVRYCTGPAAGTTSGNGALRIGTMTGPTLADPGLGGACPAGPSGSWTYGTIIQSGLLSADTLFAYDSCPTLPAAGCVANTVRTVTMTITVEPSAGRTLRLTSSATPRNRDEPASEIQP